MSPFYTSNILLLSIHNYMQLGVNSSIISVVIHFNYSKSELISAESQKVEE